MTAITYLDTRLSDKTASVKEILGSVPELVLPPGFSDQADFGRYLHEVQGLNRIQVGDPTTIFRDAREMVTKFFAQTRIDPSDIEYLVSHDLWGNLSTDVQLAGYIQQEFGLSDACTFSLHQGCSTALLTAGLGSRLLKPGKCLMFLTACFVPDPMKNRFMAPHAMFGDGLGLMVLRDPGPFEIVDFISVCSGASSHDTVNGITPVRDIVREIKVAVGAIRQVLHRNGLDVADIKQLVPQSINRQVFVDMYASALRLPQDRVFSANIPQGGHIGDVDVLRNLISYTTNADLREDDYIVLYAMGGPRGKDTSHDAVLLKYRQKEQEN